MEAEIARRNKSLRERFLCSKAAAVSGHSTSWGGSATYGRCCMIKDMNIYWKRDENNWRVNSCNGKTSWINFPQWNCHQLFSPPQLATCSTDMFMRIWQICSNYQESLFEKSLQVRAANKKASTVNKQRQLF